MAYTSDDFHLKIFNFPLSYLWETNHSKTTGVLPVSYNFNQNLAVFLLADTQLKYDLPFLRGRRFTIF